MNGHTITFDKLAYLDRLKSAGVSDEIARAHAEGLDQALRESIATKSDLDKLETALRADLSKVENGLRADLGKVENGLRADLGKVENALRADMGKLDAKIDTTAAALRAELTKAMAQQTTEFNSTIYKGVGLLSALIAAASVVSHFWK